MEYKYTKHKDGHYTVEELSRDNFDKLMELAVQKERAEMQEAVFSHPKLAFGPLDMLRRLGPVGLI